MAIEFVGGKIAGLTSSISTNTDFDLTTGLTGGIASGVSNGDMVIAAYVIANTGGATPVITDGSTNYTTIGSALYIAGSNDTDFLVAYKFVNGDTLTRFGPTTNTSYGGVAAAYVFRGVDQTTPLDVTPTTNTQGTSSDVDPPAITPSTAGAYIVVAGGAAHNRTSATLNNVGADLTDYLTVGSPNVNRDASLGIGHKPDWVSGAFDPSVWDQSGGTTTGHTCASITFALRPAVPASLVFNPRPFQHILVR